MASEQNILQVPSICVASTACAMIPSTWVSLRLLAFVAAYGTAMLAWYIAGKSRAMRPFLKAEMPSAKLIPETNEHGRNLRHYGSPMSVLA